MRSDSISKVQFALMAATESYTIQRLQAHTKLSYATVKRALQEIGAKPVAGTWPVEWTIELDKPRAFDGVPDLRRTPDEPRVIVPLRSIDNLVSMWNKSAAHVTSKLADIVLTSDTKPAEVIETFRNAAELFASVTLQLEQVADKPDWLTLLGTDEPEEQFTEQAS